MAKGMMIVDGQRVNFDGEKNVLSVIRKAGIEMPTFCYYSDLSVYGACRMCVVEDEKTGKIDASCSMEPRDGMRISTNSARLLKHRRVILELLLASHNCNCTTCEKSGHCRLQELAQQFGVRKIRFPDTREHYEIDSSSPAVLRDPNKCILCGDCVRVCEEMQGMGILNFAYRGSNLQVMPAFDRKLAETKCVSCGQCAAVCTTGAITVKNQIGEAWRAIHDPSKRVVIQIAPAVRVAVGEAFGFPAGENVLDRLVTALKLMGVDEVYDTTFGADFTTIAESEEFLERLKNVTENDFVRLPYTEAIEILKEHANEFDDKNIFWGKDLQSEHERYLTETVFKKPVFLTDYPKEIKAFYMKQNDDGKTAADLLVPGIGELIGGSQREENYEKLYNRIVELGMKPEDYSWYLDLRKYGSVTHSGYGLGFERMIMYLTGVTNIRDVIPFPRTVSNLLF